MNFFTNRGKCHPGNKEIFFLNITITLLVLFSGDLLSARNSRLEKTMVYPYTASKQRAAHIKENYRKIKIGMNQDDVRAILGEPDEVRPLYEPMKMNPREIGTTYWYLIQRLSDHGSQAGKGEKLVRITLNLHEKVTKVDHWGFQKN